MLYLCSISQTHLRNDISFIYTRHGEKTYLRRMGLPYARENIINQTTTATSRATQSLTKKSLLTAPYYHSLSCDMNIIDESSLNVEFSPEILYRTFENHAISRGGEWNGGYRPSFLLTQIFLFIYIRYPTIVLFHVIIFYIEKKIYMKLHIRDAMRSPSSLLFIWKYMYVVCLCVYKV